MPRAKRKGIVRKRRRRSSPRAGVEIALAGFAHDIRTPLTGIMALAELLHAADLPDRERRWAGAIKNTGEHLARLTTLVVDAVKAGRADLVLREEPFSPRELAHAVASALFARGEVKGLKVDTALAGNLPRRVVGDAVRLRSALENLIDNAVKFTERGRIGFAASAARMSRGRMRLTFTVTDSGIGITAADLKHLFRPFAQASEEVARRYGGAGLGLVFVKRIAQAMGGTLTVTSRPGHGSTFRLTAVVQEAVRVARPRGTGRGRPRALRVLCVEDNPYGRIVLNVVLSELGHRVSFVGSGEAAVEAAARRRHDAVLMDVALSGIDGIEATRRIRALPGPAGRVPIIGVSGRTEHDDARAAWAAGMDVYLRKPASPAELSEALQTVAAVRRA
jgi:CheY-like chemotaxis protein/anti-sigma regulatory factor (Ser/Thr protein kinase)